MYSKLIAVLTITAATILTGCSTNQQSLTGIHQGFANSQRVNFNYQSADGSPKNFNHERADVTLVLFPENEDSSRCQSIVEMAKNTQKRHSHISIFAIKGNDSGSDAVTASPLTYANERGVSSVILTDADEQVSKQFGNNPEGRYFVIDRDGRLRYSGDINDVDTLKKQTRWIVREMEKEAAFPEDCWDC